MLYCVSPWEIAPTGQPSAQVPQETHASEITYAIVSSSDGYLRQELNRLVYEVNRIGVNYNQVVATYQRLSRERRPDGSPYLNTRLLDEKVTALMRSTEGLRDEFAVVLDVIKRYISPEPTTQS